MGITIHWENTKMSAIRYEFNGGWNWDMFEETLESGFQMIEQADDRVTVILDLTQTAHIPGHFAMNMSQILSVAPPNQGNLIFVGGGEAVRADFHLIEQSQERLGNSAFYVESRAQAHRLIKGDDTQLARPSDWSDRIRQALDKK